MNIKSLTIFIVAVLFILVPAAHAADVALNIYEKFELDGSRTAYATWSSDPDAVIHVTRDETRTDGTVWIIDLSNSGHTLGDLTRWTKTWENIHRPDRFNNLTIDSANHLTFESEWTEATGDNLLDYPGGFGNGISWLAGLDSNGDRVFARITKLEIPTDECAAGLSNAYALDNWSFVKIPDGTTSINPVEGYPGKAEFFYDVNFGSDGNGVSFRTATFKTTALGSGPFTFDYTFSGFHAFSLPYATLEVFADGPDGTVTTTLVSSSTWSFFDFSGSAIIETHHGYEFGIIVGGENHDRTSRVTGTVTISNVNGDTDSDNIANDCDRCSELLGDINCDNIVNLQDLALLAQNWLVEL